MKNLQKKDTLMMKFQNSRIDKVKLEKIYGGKRIETASQDIQTGLTSGGNHDNTQTAPDHYYDGTL
ncbi:hypothetical protein [Chryseobacterium wanjuense]